MRSRTVSLIFELGQDVLGSSERENLLRRFAHQFEWEPSDVISDDAATAPFATGHIVVEYGFEKSAVLSFMRHDRPFLTLTSTEINQILRLSYNNAVDWHICLDLSSTTFLNNRQTPPLVRQVSIAEDPESPAAASFGRYARPKNRGTLRRVDQAVLETIDYWRRRISPMVGNYEINRNLSVLFNAILFTRVIEDRDSRSVPSSRPLYESVSRSSDSLANLFASVLSQFGTPTFPKVLADKFHLLSVFDSLPRNELSSLFEDFYFNRREPYDYDFALISRHALSLIYEQYVSMLRHSTDGQFRLFGELAEVVSNRQLGTVFTPQYIGRFFGRYVNRGLSASKLSIARILDPACGSGIFLRSIAEVAIDAPHVHDNQSRQELFRNLSGFDIDPSACDAAILSLSLLYASVFRDLPADLDIKVVESLEELKAGTQKFDVIVANPPYISWDAQLPDLRQRVVEALGPLHKGRADVYQAFLSRSLDSVADDGLVLMVLPQAFLSADSTASLRQKIARHFTVEVIADLSEIEVFGDTGAYVILLVLRNRTPKHTRTTVVRCRDFPGQALNEALYGRDRQNSYYEVFHIPQDMLLARQWYILPAKETDLYKDLRMCALLGDYAEIKTGMVTGGKKLFTVQRDAVPDTDVQLWPQLLSDREMELFSVPKQTEKRVFVPLVDGKLLESEEVLKERFRWTWGVLDAKREALSKRASVVNDRTPWWRPHRVPQFVLQPKIIAPHLARAPRFGYDAVGKYVTTQGPLIIPRTLLGRENIAYFLLGCLNSAAVRWQIQRFSAKYARGYCQLEPKSMQDIRVPSLNDLSVSLYGSIVSLAKSCAYGISVDKQRLAEMDLLVNEAFKLPADLGSAVAEAF